METGIHKKGSKTECKYRGISITSSAGRLYGRLLKDRIEQQIVIDEEQSDLRVEDHAWITSSQLSR